MLNHHLLETYPSGSFESAFPSALIYHDNVSLYESFKNYCLGTQTLLFWKTVSFITEFCLFIAFLITFVIYFLILISETPLYQM